MKQRCVQTQWWRGFEVHSGHQPVRNKENREILENKHCGIERDMWFGSHDNYHRRPKCHSLSRKCNVQMFWNCT